MNSKIESYIKLTEEGLKKYNPETDNLQSIIYKAMNYSLLAGGKRIRPILCLEFCRVFGGDINEAMPFACALEMIHTYSLIHDDLPAMDNDDLRRGRPTNHKVYGEAYAILAGDALLNKAFEIVSSDIMENKACQLKAILYLAKCSGTEGMIGGQIVDLESENQKIEIDTLKYLHSLKTGALIKASCVAGAIVGGADEEKIKTVEEYADMLGIAFQIKDDILDVIGDAATLGKNIGSDAESGKSTYVSIFGLEKSEELCSVYTKNALSALKKIGGETELLEYLTKSLLSRNN